MPERSDRERDPGADEDSRSFLEWGYEIVENRIGQGGIAMIAFLVALPFVVVAAHCLML